MVFWYHHQGDLITEASITDPQQTVLDRAGWRHDWRGRRGGKSRTCSHLSKFSLGDGVLFHPWYPYPTSLTMELMEKGLRNLTSSWGGGDSSKGSTSWWNWRSEWLSALTSFLTLISQLIPTELLAEPACQDILIHWQPKLWGDASVWEQTKLRQHPRGVHHSSHSNQANISGELNYEVFLILLTSKSQDRYVTWEEGSARMWPRTATWTLT